MPVEVCGVPAIFEICSKDHMYFLKSVVVKITCIFEICSKDHMKKEVLTLVAQQSVSHTSGPYKGYLTVVARKLPFIDWWPKATVKSLVAHTRAIGGPGIFLRCAKRYKRTAVCAEQ